MQQEGILTDFTIENNRESIEVLIYHITHI